MTALAPAAGTGGVGGQARYGPWQYVAAQQLGQSAGGATPLPVVLATFTATPAGLAAVRLAWATASKHGSAAFGVGRSLDGQGFEKVGTVAAAGTTAARTIYTFLDDQLTQSLSTTASGRWPPMARPPTRPCGQSRSLSHSVIISPNPAPGAAVAVLNALGQVVATATADTAGPARLALPTGLYVVRCGSRTARLVVE